MIRRYVLPIALPVLVIGGYVVSGGFDAWADFVGPFLITYWIGLGFTNAWGVVKESLHGAPPLVLAITGVVGGLIVLAMLGGPGVLITDPWLFGVAIAPGLELLWPWWQKRKADRASAEQGRR